MVDSDAMTPTAAKGWVDDLRDLEADGGTFFGLTQYLYRIRKPE